ncbi:MAG: lipopolysaccharide biosynthesis protein [bacterium]|jgi:O-antigen/teichoic acid export membrane protein
MEPATATPSLKTNFAWIFAGNAFNAASQWALLSLIAKLGSTTMLGEYALGLAIAAPVAMLAHMNLRAVLATDVAHRHPFGDYFAVRAAASAVGVLATAAVVFASGFSGRIAAVTVILGVSLASEALSDLYYGLMQRRERMDLIARSMVIRGTAAVAALGVTLWATRDLLWAVAALAVSRAAVLAAYDRRRGAEGEDRARSGGRSQWEILRAALPLGAVLMFSSLTTNLPRYAIEWYFGTPELGAFAAVASALTAGNTVMNALGHSATPRLARLFNARDLRAFRSLAAKLAALAFSLGVVGAIAAALVGEFVLAILYRPEYAAYNGLLVGIMGAGTMVYTAVALGYVLTSMRLFAPQLPLLAVVAASCGVASWVLVPAFGLAGAAAAIAFAAAVEIAGQLILLLRSLRRSERQR